MDSFIKKIFDNAKIEDLYGDSEFATAGQEGKMYFENILKLLCDFKSCPNAAINSLCKLAFKLIGNQMVPVVMMSKLSTLSFAFEKKGSTELAMIMLPTNFAQRCKDDPYMQFGFPCKSNKRCI